MEIAEFKVQLVSSSEELEACQSIRHQVFIEEQMVPADREYDGKDDEAFHVLCVCSKRRQAVATFRVLLMRSNEANLGRISVLPEFRKRGLGRRVVQELEIIAKSKGASRASLTTLLSRRILQGTWLRTCEWRSVDLCERTLSTHYDGEYLG
jgi:predicted GNAT family N-acyltransferase